MTDDTFGPIRRRGGMTRILVVDDEVPHVKALCDVLRGHDYEPIGCTSGSEALATLRTTPYEILMTDLLMPDMDGVTLLREAQRIDADLMGIIMTGQGSVESAVQAMRSGAQDYVLKPLQLNVVLAVLQRARSMRRLSVDNRALLHRLSERTKELEAANAELEAFAYSVSHDLRAPLRAVSGFHELLELDFADQLPPQARDLLCHIGAGASRMNTLIDDMLRLSQLGRSPLEKRAVDMRRLAAKALDQLPNSVREPGTKVHLGALPPAQADMGLLEHVFTNLLSNAFKFTRGRTDPAVWMDFELTNEGVVYFVRDNGVGFDMSDARELFSPFQRLHRSDQFEGSGVGLSIVRRIIARHGGRVWAEAQAGDGATVYFTLGSSAS